MAQGHGQSWSILGGLRQLGPGFVLDGLRAILLGERRSLAEDSERVVALMDPPPRVEGLELIPPRGPFLLVANHLQTPDLWVGWIAAAIAHYVAVAREAGGRELHWISISEWRWFELCGRWVSKPLTSLLFPRVAKVWGLIPTPQRPSDVSGRARALRQALGYLRAPARVGGGVAEPVGVFPEGRGTFALGEAMPGSGAFLYRISALGVPLLPVGVHRDAGVLVIRFGAPFFLGPSPSDEREELDRWAREQVMVAIARLLPREMWGYYASAVEPGG